jgi:hypothetical protein
MISTENLDSDTPFTLEIEHGTSLNQDTFSPNMLLRK